jgi:DNA-binding transcriptional LysR family regulator
MRMNSKQLTVFHEVMRCGSFSEAARNLNRTQPAISAMVANLEQELGYKLFIRRAGQLLPVPEAHYLYAETQDIMDRMRTVEMNMKRVGDLEQGQLRMVSMPGPSVILIPQLLARFASTRDGLNIALLTRSSAQVRHLIATQQFDVGLADWSDEDIPDNTLLKHDRVTLNCVCALPAGDPLAAQPVVSPQDLRGRNLAALFPGHVTFRLTSQTFAQAGVPFQPRFETQYFYPLLSFVEAGLACAVIDQLTAESYRMGNPESPQVVFRPFAPVVPFSVAIVSPKHRPLSRISQDFTTRLKEELQRYASMPE